MTTICHVTGCWEKGEYGFAFCATHFYRLPRDIRAAFFQLTKHRDAITARDVPVWGWLVKRGRQILAKFEKEAQP